MNTQQDLDANIFVDTGEDPPQHDEQQYELRIKHIGFVLSNQFKNILQKGTKVLRIIYGHKKGEIKDD